MWADDNEDFYVVEVPRDNIPTLVNFITDVEEAYMGEKDHEEVPPQRPWWRKLLTK